MKNLIYQLYLMLYFIHNNINHYTQMSSSTQQQSSPSDTTFKKPDGYKNINSSQSKPVDQVTEMEERLKNMALSGNYCRII